MRYYPSDPLRLKEQLTRFLFPSIHFFTHTLYIHSSTHAFAHPCSHPPMHPPIHASTHPCMHASMHTPSFRYLLFLQLERDLKHGKLLCTSSELIHLSAFQLQGEPSSSSSLPLFLLFFLFSFFFLFSPLLLLLFFLHSFLLHLSSPPQRSLGVQWWSQRKRIWLRSSQRMLAISSTTFSYSATPYCACGGGGSGWW